MLQRAGVIYPTVSQHRAHGDTQTLALHHFSDCFMSLGRGLLFLFNLGILLCFLR